MSNIVTDRSLIRYAGVALALSAAFIVVSMPKQDTAAPIAATDVAKVADGANAACRQTWPYYERSCLHDRRQRDDGAHTVRVIAINGPAEHVSRQ